MSSKKDKKKAKKKIKKYYKEREEREKKAAALKKGRLAEDAAEIMRLSGMATNRATEDYLKNVDRINSGEQTDLADINEYVATQSGRTQEDLDTSLAKEARRFDLESDRINQSLAASGLTFSERTPEQIAKATNKEITGDINTTASRSFADIARYEATKTRDVETKYGDLREDNELNKNRTLEDIINEQTAALKANQRGIEDADIGLQNNLQDLIYDRDTDVATTEQMFKNDEADTKSINIKVENIGA